MDGTPFGRYRLLDLLGRGGMGEVWRAHDPEMNRVVALKVLPPNFAGDPMFQERFRREARSAAGLDEPHVVPIYEFGEIDGRLYVTMRLIKGRDLQDLLHDGPLPPARAVGIIEQIASALHAAHEIGLVHRDVKPSNILVAEEDFAYLIDFGIARAAEETGLTSTGATIGTWAYMAPERLNTGSADARADIYALACVLHEALTGQRAFPGNSLEQQIVGHLTTPPPRPAALQPGVPDAMDAVIATGMAKNPDERYPTTKDLARAARAALPAPVQPSNESSPETSAAAEPAPTLVENGVPAVEVEDAAAQPTLYGPHPHITFPPDHAAPTEPTLWGPTLEQTARTPQAPILRRPNRRTWIVAATVTAVVLAVVAVIIIVGNQSSGGGTTSATSSVATASSTADPGDMARLMTMVPNDIRTHCQPASTTNLAALATVSCQADQLSIFYSLFPDEAAMQNGLEHSGFGAGQGCPGAPVGLTRRSWSRPGNPQQSGTMICYWASMDDVHGLSWSTDSQLLVGTAKGAPKERIEQVYQWWAARYQ